MLLPSLSYWGVTKEEAQDMLKAWYADRPEVKHWQDQVRTRGAL
jgi:hypothetical protein